ncbi:hypothetical protein MMC34_002117 [Xylographa carneopallida]|nr:hypothetical protein [Xylographa carneopallida]
MDVDFLLDGPFNDVSGCYNVDLDHSFDIEKAFSRQRKTDLVTLLRRGLVNKVHLMDALGIAVEFCAELYMSSWRNEKLVFETVWFGVYEVLYWITTASKSCPQLDKIQQTLGEDLHSLPAIRDAVEAMSERKIGCQNRLWNLVMATERSIVDLPSILSILQGISLGQERHQDCTAQVCLSAHNNTTVLRQLHICGREDCHEKQFSPYELDSLYHTSQTDRSEFVPKAWGIPKTSHDQGAWRSPGLKCERYMAISHVWSDGTGMGLKTPGNVNSCLSNFFAKLARELDCDGIWWDTICIPTERDKRRIALSTMHENYANAKCTLVHDRGLMNFTWKDDGSPCIALALSTWFTRGWTALELWASKSVKILFRTASGKLCIKDLDTDIITKQKNRFAHPAHSAVSIVIRRIRGEFGVADSDGELPIDHLLASLKSRNTSWTQDRMILAGLMAGVDNFDASWSQPEITKSILKKFGSIKATALLHGQVTMCNSGPWSWCPSSIFELKAVAHRVTFRLEIKDDGAVTGIWRSISLNREDAEMLQPFSSHISDVSRIITALRDSKKGRLLFPFGCRPASGKEHDYYLLVVDLEETKDGRRCKYIGTVMGRVDVRKGVRELIQLGTEETEPGG